MHKRNPHIHGYDMQALVSTLPELAQHVVRAPNGRDSIAFSNPESVKILNKALLAHHYGVKDWDIPKGYLCPPIPGRLDYLLSIDDLLKDRKKSKEPIRVLDIGTGANLIYPLLGASHFNWQWVASDIDADSVKNGKDILERNSDLKNSIELRLQKNKQSIFKGIIQSGDFFDVTVCNPPFHESRQAAIEGTQRKNRNLNRNKQKRGSSLKKLDKAALNFSGQSNELWCEGGERRFVSGMIDESADVKDQVGLFTCLISKKENVAPLKTKLKMLGASVSIHEMAQGQKISRYLAWTFKVN